MTRRHPTSLVCIEVGGSGVETVIFDRDVSNDMGSCAPGVHTVEGVQIALAVPGTVQANTDVTAANLGWHHADPAKVLQLPSTPALVLNDAEAAAIGEWVLRSPGSDDLLFVGLGTGIGASLVKDGRSVADNLLAHTGRYSDLICTCGRVGCLETVAGGWALPSPLNDDHLVRAVDALATALALEPLAAGALIVLSGGMAENNPSIVEGLRTRIANRVEPSLRPAGYKSAAAFGLRWVFETADAAADAGRRRQE